MKTIFDRTVPIALTAFLASAALAVGETSTSSSSQSTYQRNQSSTQAQGATSEKSSKEIKVTEKEAQQQVSDVNKASKLIGMNVKNTQDEELGEIKELVIDLQSGKVAYAVLSVGSTLGFGGRNVAVPIEALRVARGEQALLLDLPKQQVSNAPGFSDENWPDLNAAAKGQTIGLAKSTQLSRESSQGGTGTETDATTGASQSETNKVDDLEVDDLEPDDSATGGTLDETESTSGESELNESESPTLDPAENERDARDIR